MGCRVLDLEPHRNARSIKHKINTLFEELKSNNKIFKSLSSQELLKSIVNRIDNIIKLIDEELQTNSPTTYNYNLLKEIKTAMLRLTNDIENGVYKFLDLVSIRELATEQLYKIQYSYNKYLAELTKKGA